MNLIFDFLWMIHKQLRHCEHKLDILLQKQNVVLPPELVQAGQDLAVKSKALQAALDAAPKNESLPKP